MEFDRFLRVPAEQAARQREQIIGWLNGYKWTYSVTLTPNSRDQQTSPDKMYRLLREWDARMNRCLFGPKWTKRQDERLFFFFFLEKPVVNPHWHGLLRLDPSNPTDRPRLEARFKGECERLWKRVVRAGTTDVKMVHAPEGISKYVTKELAGVVQYECFVCPRTFDPTAS